MNLTVTGQAHEFSVVGHHDDDSPAFRQSPEQGGYLAHAPVVQSADQHADEIRNEMDGGKF